MATHEVAAALAVLAAANAGRLTPDQVVEAASDPASPLHDQFEWDDSVAAVEYRRDQARTLIRSVNVKIEVGGVILRAPQYVRDPAAERAQGYATLQRLKSDEDVAREAVVAEFVRASAALSRARAIAAALGLSDQINVLHEQVSAFTAKLKEDVSAEAPH